MLFLLLHIAAVGSVSAKDKNVMVELDAGTIVNGFKAAMRSDYLKKLADNFASKAAQYLIEGLEKKNKRIKSSEYVDQSRHKVGRKGSRDTSGESDHTKSRHLAVSLLSSPKAPQDHKDHNTSHEHAGPRKKPEPVETGSKPRKPRYPKISEDQLMELLKDPSADGDYPDREAQLTDFESKKNVKPLRTHEMINGKRFRARSIDLIYL